MLSLAAALEITNTRVGNQKKAFHIIFSTSQGQLIELPAAIMVGHKNPLNANGGINVRPANNSSSPIWVDTWLINKINGQEVIL